MTTDTRVRCALGLTSRSLSDFRSGGLSVSEMERLRGHIGQCPACRARLDAFEVGARALRDYPDLNRHAELWQGVRAGIAARQASEATPGQRLRRHGWRPESAKLWTTFGSVAAVVALSVGFVALFFSRGGWPPTSKGTTSTPITIHSGSLTWRQVFAPKGFPRGSAVMGITYGGITLAPSDGNTMYACLATRRFTPTPRVWATHDAGAHWSNVTPNGLPTRVGGCLQWIDANDALRTVVSFFPMLSPQQPAPPAQWVTYATTDGGATWSQPTGLRDGMFITLLASAHGRIYAQRTGSAPDGDTTTGLYVSRDGMQSWTRIDTTLPARQPNPPQIHDLGKVFQTWVNPSSGEVLALTFAGALWSTEDDGAHWAKIAYPQGVYATDPWAPTLAVGGPTVGAHLTVCGVFASLKAPGTDQWLECTADDGHTWIRRPSAPASTTGYLTLNLNGVGSDGSLYVISSVPSTGANASGITIDRLPPGAQAPSDWQPLGAIPGSEHGGGGFQLASSDNGALFWVSPSSTTQDKGTYLQPNFYIATYP